MHAMHAAKEFEVLGGYISAQLPVWHAFSQITQACEWHLGIPRRRSRTHLLSRSHQRTCQD